MVVYKCDICKKIYDNKLIPIQVPISKYLYIKNIEICPTCAGQIADFLDSLAAALFKSLGMDLSTATGIFYRQALRCHGLPFEVKVDEPNAVTYAAMEAAEKGEDMYGPFDSVADLMEAVRRQSSI